jgi:hypothetical protein
MYLAGVDVPRSYIGVVVPGRCRCTSQMRLYLDNAAVSRTVGVDSLIGVDIPCKRSCTPEVQLYLLSVLYLIVVGEHSTRRCTFQCPAVAGRFRTGSTKKISDQATDTGTDSDTKQCFYT